MTKIKIITDSSSDLTQEEIEKYDIEVIPMNVLIGEDSYIDKVTITPKEFIEKMRLSEELPKTSQPSVGQFRQVFEKWRRNGFDIISIHISSGLSGTAQAAQTAANMMADTNIKVVDSLFISRALAYQVIEAANYVKQGKSIDEILAHIHNVRQNSHLYINVETLENLVKGGRIGRGRALIGSLLKIKPIATLTDGVYTPVAKARSHNKIIQYYTNQVLSYVKTKQVKEIGIAHADALHLANKIKSRILEYLDVNIVIIETTPIIATHTGAGAIGFMFYTD
ncbi:DegV family protein [Bacillus sp. HMF5848]|uniref:DegV family protein n=1 Tax=Bacillus sp. HMF5848 TaxID=2495421 RepID=UPI000F78E2DA|nr:DegV family protein [Bacillus sp. HMF5848]RSK27286.1 DegV family protein [Bacillus sp. HMF5848]